jgi:hypothetical protein
MRKQQLTILRKALTKPPGLHLNDETLAELVSAEQRGEDIEELYPDEVNHIEGCIRCVQAYVELTELITAASHEMSVAATAISSTEVFVELLSKDVFKQAGALPNLQSVLTRIVADLPTLFTALPGSANDIKIPEVEALIEKALPPTEASRFTPAIMNSIREHWISFKVYLEKTSAEIWGRMIQSFPGTESNWKLLRLSLTPGMTIPTLGTHQTGEVWLLADQYVGEPIPFHFTAQADRIDLLACRLIIRTDRPGLHAVAGRPVRLIFTGKSLEGRTDHTGAVRFEPVPIAAIPGMEIRFQA